MYVWWMGVCIHHVSVSVSVSGHGVCSGDRHVSRHLGSSFEKSRRKVRYVCMYYR